MEVVGSVNQAGAVDVLYGSPDGLSESAAQFLHQDGADLHESSEAGDRFGPAVANGDFDGDGFADLAIGSPGEDLKTLGAGAVAILYGGPAGVGTRRDRTIHEPSSAQRHGDHFGAALATGDLDGDGFADLAIGTPDARAAGASSAGSVTVVYGSSKGLRPATADVWSQANGTGDPPSDKVDVWHIGAAEFGHATGFGLGVSSSYQHFSANSDCPRIPDFDFPAWQTMCDSADNLSGGG